MGIKTLAQARSNLLLRLLKEADLSTIMIY